MVRRACVGPRVGFHLMVQRLAVDLTALESSQGFQRVSQNGDIHIASDLVVPSRLNPEAPTWNASKQLWSELEDVLN
jgi:hypothetical protein